MSTIRLLIATLFLVSAQTLYAGKLPLPSPTIPDGLGYNIHFTDPKPGEMEMLAESGATIIRMDFGWGGTERQKGVYDFRSFDRLTDALEKHKIRPLYILDYSNRHYDEGLSPYTEEGRAAFARWAAAGVEHFKGRGILWEMYNEPNISFWKPKPDPEKYILLALEVGKAIRNVAPDELYIGPATSEIDFEFLEKCFQAGLLEYWDAVSVHPYRQRAPETVIPEYAKLKFLIEKYAPKGKTIPILSAEWGYSSAWNNYNDEIQGKMLPRQWMTNLACGVPISIWYDWHDDGTDPKEPEHHFGTVNHAHHKDRTPVYDLKPSYIAAKTFTDTFRGFRYNKRIWTGDNDDFVFLFDKEKQDVKLAAWTVSKEPKTITIPSSPGSFEAVSYLGEKRADATADKDGLKLTVSDGPVYLTPKKPNDLLRVAAHWETLDLFMYNFWMGHFNMNGEADKKLLNPLDRSIQVRPAKPKDFPVEEVAPGKKIDLVHSLYSLEECDKPSQWLSEIQVDGVELRQVSHVLPINPIYMSPEIIAEKGLLVHLENPQGFAFLGTLEIDEVNGVKNLEYKEEGVIFQTGQKRSEILFPGTPESTGDFQVAMTLWRKGSNGSYVLWRVPLKKYRQLDDFSKHTPETLEKAWGVYPDGDAKVASELSLKLSDKNAAEITYKFEDGWKFLRLAPKTEELRKIEGIPKAFHVRLTGDASSNAVRMRVRDSKGQTFQMGTGKLTLNGPQSFTFSLEDSSTFHWGGPNDAADKGRVHGPIEFDSLIIDGTQKAFGPSTISVSSIVLEYEP